MGSVMAVVQITVQIEAGPRMLGTGAAMCNSPAPWARHFGTATVAAILFSILAVTDRDTANLFGAIIDQGPEAIAALPAARQAIVQSEIADAFRAAFLTIALFTTGRHLARLVDAAAPPVANRVRRHCGARPNTRQTLRHKAARNRMIVDAQVHL